MSPSSHAVLPPEAPQPVKGGVEPLIVRGPRRPDLMRHEMLPDVFEATAQRLPHKVALIEMTSGTQIIVRDNNGWVGGADPRREGTASGD